MSPKLNRLIPLALLASLSLSSGLAASASKQEQSSVTGAFLSAPMEREFHETFHAPRDFHVAQPPIFRCVLPGTFHQAISAPAGRDFHETFHAPRDFHVAQLSIFDCAFPGTFHQAISAPAEREFHETFHAPRDFHVALPSIFHCVLPGASAFH